MISSNKDRCSNGSHPSNGNNGMVMAMVMVMVIEEGDIYPGVMLVKTTTVVVVITVEM